MFCVELDGLRAIITQDGHLSLQAKRGGGDWVPVGREPGYGLQLKSDAHALQVVRLFADSLGVEVRHLPDAADLGEVYELRPR